MNHNTKDPWNLTKDPWKTAALVLWSSQHSGLKQPHCGWIEGGCMMFEWQDIGDRGLQMEVMKDGALECLLCSGGVEGYKNGEWVDENIEHPTMESLASILNWFKGGARNYLDILR